MDPVTQAIIIEASKQGITAAYQGLKYLLSQKFGPQSKVVKATEELKDDPSSLARQAVLHEEIRKVRAHEDPDLLRQANSILSINRSTTRIKAGHDVATGNARITYGRPGIVALVAIALVAIFALLIWQAFPLLRNTVTSITGQSQIPEASPGDTIIALCHFSKLNRADWIYQLYTTDSFKQEVSGSQFTQQWNGLDFNDSCTLSPVTQSGDTATGELTVQRSNGTSSLYAVTFKKELSQDSNGKPIYIWMIDKLQSK